MNYEEKVKLFREGLYRMPVPPVTTELWSEKNWIDFIDSQGEWNPLKDRIKKMIRMNNGYLTVCVQAVMSEEKEMHIEVTQTLKDCTYEPTLHTIEELQTLIDQHVDDHCSESLTATIFLPYK